MEIVSNEVNEHAEAEQPLTGLGDFKADFRADVTTGVLSAGVEDLLVLVDLGVG